MSGAIGFVIEVPNSIIDRRDFNRLKNNYNKRKNPVRILDFNYSGKIELVDRDDKKDYCDIIGKKLGDGKICNFAVTIEVDEETAKRVAALVNVLGNDRIIRERIPVFCNKTSMIAHIEEFEEFFKLFDYLSKNISGFKNRATYYCPYCKIY